MADRRRVLLVTRNLPPLRGGMERLNLGMIHALFDPYDVAVVGPIGCRIHVTGSLAAVDEVPVKPLGAFLLRGLLAVAKSARNHPPDVVVAGSGLTAPLAWLAAKLVRAPFVVYLHGLDIIAPSRIYQWLWLPFIRRADLVLANSCNTAELAKRRGVPSRLVQVLHPGTDLPGSDTGAAHAFRAHQGLGDRRILLSVGRLTPRKGLAEFIRRALPDILVQHPDAVLLVIGCDADDALNMSAGSQRQRIVDAARDAQVSEALRILPHCDDLTLGAAYRAADVHIFPVLDLPGDVEGFGMVAIEAAAHGLPTVAFAVGGVPDAVVDGRSGSLVQASDYRAFSACVHDWLRSHKDEECRAACHAVAEGFSWERFGERFRFLLHSVCSESK